MNNLKTVTNKELLEELDNRIEAGTINLTGLISVLQEKQKQTIKE